MPTPSYIAKDRHGGYLFRIKIPTELLTAFGGKRALVKSLQTYHRPTALKLARKLAAQTQDFFDQIKMSEQDLHKKRIFIKAKRSAQRGKLDDILSGRVTVKDGSIVYTETNQSLEDIESLGDQNLEIIVNEHTRLEKNIAGYQKMISDLDLQIKHIRTRKLEIEAEQIAGLAPMTTTGNASQISELREQLLTELRETIAQANQIPDSLLISELWTEYKAMKRTKGEWVKEKMISERDSQMNDFIEIIGGDIPASRVDHAIVMKTIDGLTRFPLRRRGAKLAQFERLEDIPKDTPTISTSTQSQRIDNLIQFFEHLAIRRLIPNNPFKGQSIDRESQNYATPTTKDVNEWFNLPDNLIRSAWQFWIPRIALLCGSRAGEIAQLTPLDVKKDLDTGIWYFLITDEGDKSVKTRAGIRKVPIHQDLIDHGFLTYCDMLRTAASVTLWPRLNAKGDGGIVGTISDYWARLRDRHNILSEPVNEYGERKTFHSLRRVIQNKLNSDGVDIVTIQTIVGHEPSLGSSKSYLDEPKPLHITNAALQKLRIEGLSWEHPKKFSLEK